MIIERKGLSPGLELVIGTIARAAEASIITEGVSIEAGLKEQVS